MVTSLPARARVVVVGGGVIGTSVAYHLAQAGWRDVVLLERDRLTSGTTWHAAGLIVTFGSLSETSTRMRQYTRDLYARLESETGQATGFAPVGFIELATDPDRLEEYRRVAAFNRYLGVDVHEIGPAEVHRLFPLARTDDVLAGFYVAEDGRANPVDVTMALAKGARQQGVRIVEGVAATGFRTRRGPVGREVRGVLTDEGEIECEYVVNCAGMWARQLGALAGVSVPLQAAEHYYLITDTIPDLPADLPVLEDPGSFGYIREETGGLMVGLFEGVSAPWRVEGIPGDFSFGQIPPDWDRLGPYVEAAMSRVPVTLDAGVRTFFCGPESFTPDLAPIVGEAPELRNYFVAAGLNSIGILTGGGIGRAVARWIVDGVPDVDVTGIDIARLHPYQANPEYLRQRTTETLGKVYRCHYPGLQWRTARDARRSPLHDRLAVAGASFRDVSGWESPDWYAVTGTGTTDPGGTGFTGPLTRVPEEPELTWGRPRWFANWAGEHRAAREGVVVMDMSFMAKFLVTGRDAGQRLERLSANRVDGEPGRVTYTQWLNDRGGIQADLTVTKLDDDRFWVVASDTAHRQVESLLHKGFADAHAFAADVTSGWAQLNLQGPLSRELLTRLTTADVSDAALPYRGARELDLGLARALCLRITYVGELGYELYVPTEQAVHVYDRVLAAGRDLGLRHAGLRALSSLRMEKAYRDYGHDIDNTDSVLEAGLGFAVAWDKPGGFIGRDATRARRESGPLRRRLVQVLAGDPAALLHHGEVLRRNGLPMGYLRAASYGFTLGGAVGLAMLEPDVVAPGQLPAEQAITQDWLNSGHWELEIAGTRCDATVSLRPLYDPKNERVTG
ncbi:MAG TPA: FAD-dependent oxidoreductase [Kineosporiaceae bacterium]|nr:FAD-dependent oxidoreductase [Kineosporiaceae bacterium]